MSNFLDLGFWQGIGSNFAFLMLSYLATQLRTFLVNRRPFQSTYWNVGFLLTLLGIWLAINTYVLWSSWPFITSLFTLVTSTVIISYFTWQLLRDLRNFESIGLRKADLTVASGLSYDGALKLCHNHLEFLGIGAAKLTASAEFEKAMERCHRDNVPIKFLLAAPDNALLLSAANRRGVDANAYKQKVINSLRILANHKIDRKRNVEVRFYPGDTDKDWPVFRLMFINNALCLVSCQL